MVLEKFINFFQSHEFKRSSRIDVELKKEKFIRKKEIKLLLLGTSGCGKSTLLKQMKILHLNGYTEEEKLAQRGIIFSNVIESIASILLFMEEFNIKFDDDSLEEEAFLVTKEYRNRRDEDDLSTICEAIVNLWNDPGVQNAVERGNEYQLPDCASYFLNNVKRIRQYDYIPTEEDILLSRKRTTGIVEVKFQLSKYVCRVFDVGGQRSERKKWIHCFDNVNAIIFLAAISEFDQVLLEDNITNRLIEALNLFSIVISSPWFKDTSIILFLNKKDIFLEKSRRNKSIKVCFSSYSDPNTYEDQLIYIEHQFKKHNTNKEKMIFTYPTCATDTNQIQIILGCVYDICLKKNLKTIGLS